MLEYIEKTKKSILPSIRINTMAMTVKIPNLPNDTKKLGVQSYSGVIKLMSSL